MTVTVEVVFNGGRRALCVLETEEQAKAAAEALSKQEGVRYAGVTSGEGDRDDT
jgi:hypothetical protein